MTANKARIGLINVVLNGDYQYEQELPLGLAAIGAFLRQQNYEVVFHQCFASKGIEQYELAAKVEAGVYGFQLNMVNYTHIRAVVEKIKAVKPEAVVVLGGPFLVSLSEKIMKNETLYDYIVVGEGEKTVLELLQALAVGEKDFSGIDGLVWRNSHGAVIRNNSRNLIEDLDQLPFPARDYMDQARKDPVDGGLVESVRISTSRGCIGRCSFCCVNLYNKVQKGKQWRGRSPQNIVDELEYLSKEFGAKIFNFSDSSFEDPGNIGKVRAREVCQGIIERKLPVSIKVYMRCETMKTPEDIELLRLYKKAGIDVVIIGAEAGSEYELKLYEKHATLADNYRAAKLLKELDLFYVLVGFIMFGPNSTLSTLRSNIEYLQKNGLTDNLMQVANVLMLIRDSKLYHILQAEGRVIEALHPWELPKYKFLDKMGERAAQHWQNVFTRYPVTLEVNKLQVNIGNVVSRMTNPMNVAILEALTDEYAEFRKKQAELSAEFGSLQYEYFLKVLDMLEQNCSDATLQVSGDEFFGKTYERYFPIYEKLYNGFLDKVSAAGFGMSGLIFRHFHSAMSIDGTKRI